MEIKMIMLKNKFKLRHRPLRLQICGKRFSLSIDERLIYECGRVREMAHECVTALEDTNGSSAKTLKRLRTSLVKSIDALLGSGASETLSLDTDYSLLDLIALLSFITDRVTAAARLGIKPKKC